MLLSSGLTQKWALILSMFPGLSLGLIAGSWLVSKRIAPVFSLANKFLVRPSPTLMLNAHNSSSEQEDISNKA